MVSEVYSLALKDTLNAMVHACPDIKNALIFSEDGEITAADDGTPEDIAVHTVDALDEMLGKAEPVGSVDRIAFAGTDGRLNVSHFDNFYLVTVASAQTNADQPSDLTRVLVPTVLKVLKRINLLPVKDSLEELEVERKEPSENDAEEVADESSEEARTEEKEKQSAHEQESKPIPEAQVNQFIVESLGGMFVSPDTVRVDNDLLLKWKEMYENKEIKEVEITTFGGKSSRRKVKPIKEAKFEGKGMIQMHEKAQSLLEIKKGELVRVKPVIE